MTVAADHTPEKLGEMPGMGGRVLLAGLGNPGPRYVGNRHNAGFLVLDELAHRLGGRFKTHKSGAEILEGHLAGRQIVLAKPLSFMNLSGNAIGSIAKFFSVAPAGIVVVHDELDVPYGTLRLKYGGGVNGHNGLKSIAASLGTKDFYRARFGIGRPPGRMSPADFVLKDFSATERKELAFYLDRTADAIEMLLTAGLTATQNVFHAVVP